MRDRRRTGSLRPGAPPRGGRANAIWQADHTELDLLVKDGDGTAAPALADDHPGRLQPGGGRLRLSLAAPSAIQTALALRQAIWRKPQPGWHVCGIPVSSIPTTAAISPPGISDRYPPT